MKNSIFIDEFSRRMKNDDNAYRMVGAELRRLRINQSQTLSTISSNICSVSYLCKIETAKMKPNRAMLTEICKKLDLSVPKIDLLFNLKNLLMDCVEKFYRNNITFLSRAYEECKGFENYRSKLIQLIFYIATFRLDEASLIVNDLFKITSVMSSEELIIFMVFHSILSFYEEKYHEVLDNLTMTRPYSETGETIKKIIYLICLQCYLKLNNPRALILSEQLIKELLDSTEFEMADYVRYLSCIFMMNNSMINDARQQMKNLQKKVYLRTIEFYLDLKENNLKAKTHYYTELRPFARLIFIYVFDKINYNKYFESLDKRRFYDCDFSPSIAQYLTLKDEIECYNEISDVIIPNLAITNNAIEAQFFLIELSRICSNLGKYKNFNRAFERLTKNKFR
ncbi:MAG: hypothetical protein K2I42_05880 [Anaeroplasmataceae bacterium]|nr:hypothetical protein [Anaeroplasmataceae bacterium]